MSNEVPVSGIILSSQPIGEYDRRLVLLTKERGKISCFARGARKPSSPLSGNTRSFSFGFFYIYEGRSTYSVHSAQIQNYFEDLIMDYDATLYACYFAEIADYYGREGIEAKDAINLLYMAFCALTDKRLDKELTKSVYEIRAVVMAGECPPLEDFLRPEEISEDLKKLFSYIAACDLEKLFKFTLGDEWKATMKKVSERLVKVAVDKRLKSKELLPA